MMKQILEGVNFLHENGVMHRDLKTANILINSKAELKICDFGLSRAGGVRVGSVHAGCRYAVVQSAGASYNKKEQLLLVGDRYVVGGVHYGGIGVDVGDSPATLHKQNLEGGASPMLRRRVAGAAARFGGGEVLSGSGIDLLEKLLEMDPGKRITAKDALNHAWFN